MKRPFWINLLYSILAVIPIAVVSVIAYFIFALLGGFKFYAPLTVVVAAALTVYIVCSIFGWFTPRIRGIAFACFAGLCLLATGGYELNKAYVNSLAEVSEKELSLEQYQPFQPGSKISVLGQPASYQITDKLPRLDGATALYPLYSAFVQAVYPKASYDLHNFNNQIVLCSSTSYAYQRLISGETDIIFAAAPSLSQQKEAKLAGRELVLTPIGREAFVFFVNKRNPVNGLTTEQIKDIYSGELTNWKDAGGRNDRIRAFQREENSGSQTMLQKIMQDRTLMNAPHEDVMDLMSGIISQTSNYRNYKNAIGFSFLYYASEMNRSDDIKLLAIDGTEPNKDSIKSGTYPYTVSFYAVTAGTSNPNVQPFLDWIVSPEGQELVSKTGYVPIN
ncbi:PstS family phosphate ABC transporter substrate-binding protein [Paenibacillus ihuae]|uniref:PstS family phosphate ABC transporter substrate-binding protein n=1 Tax=Paenibacillus ihuae TaxID=1232431 RepID=UPI0006D5A585|nr:substrate-binding domain-containing protein [Paenibacillus ihuae]